MANVLRVLAWVVSVFVFIGGVGLIFQGQVLAGVLSLGVAACAFPPLWRTLSARGVSPPLWMRWAGAIVLMIGAGLANPQPATDGEPTAAVQEGPKTAEVDGPRPQRAAERAPPIAASTNWKIAEEVSALDDSRNVSAAMDASRKVKGWLTSERPTLVARCKEGETEVYLDTKSQVHSELDFDAGESLAAIKYRVGSGAPRAARVSLSTDGSALFMPNPIGLLKELRGEERFVVEYTPFQAGLGTAVFQIEGVQEVVSRISSACDWAAA